MKDPFLLVLLISIYLYAIYAYLPRHMKGRPPYKLKTTIQVYNIIQVFGCLYLMKGMAMDGWFNQYTLRCQTVDYSNDESAVRMLKYVYWTLILKVFELVETSFFILRHKMTQVSALHVYHHCSTLTFAWLTCKYMGGGMATFSMFLNNTVHVVMYSYYFLAALGPTVQKNISWIKPKITALQMTQFGIMLLHVLQGLHPDCHAMPMFIIYIYIPNLLILFGFFFNFYYKSYKSRKDMKLQ